MGCCDRRIFLKNSAFALVSLGISPRFLTRTVFAQSTNGRRVLVAIFQRGAVDGLSMVVPFNDANYQALRGSIKIAPPGASGGAVDLDGTFGLHPALAPLKSIYDAGSLALVHACGSPDSTRSHFEAQDYMETGTPGSPVPDGWLNRYLVATNANFPGIALAGSMPRSFSGSGPAIAVSSLESLVVPSDPAAGLLRATRLEMHQGRTDIIGTTGQAAIAAMDAATYLDPANYQPAGGAQYPQTDFGNRMKNIAQLIKADIGLELAFTEIGGWDTHNNQGGATGDLAGNLDEFSRGLAAFHQDLGDRMADVCLLTMSEFGRTVAENGSGGSDHGHGTAMLVLGGTVSGGRVYGAWPGLAPEQLYQGRDLAVTTDFRTLFGEIVEKHLGNSNVGAVFPGFHYDPASALGVIRT